MLLDITINTTFFTYLIIALVALFASVYYKNGDLKRANKSLQEEVDTKMNSLRLMQLEYRTNINDMALAEFEKYKATQLESDKKLMETTLVESAATMLQQWQIDKEDSIRKDAIARSLSVNLGKITEHWLPFHTSFKFNPKDARFIGSPIDLIVFDGCAEGKDIIDIYFIEVKTGNSRLTPIQQKIKSSVFSKRINWVEMNPATL